MTNDPSFVTSPGFKSFVGIGCVVVTTVVSPIKSMSSVDESFRYLSVKYCWRAINCALSLSASDLSDISDRTIESISPGSNSANCFTCSTICSSVMLPKISAEFGFRSGSRKVSISFTSSLNTSPFALPLARYVSAPP